MMLFKFCRILTKEIVKRSFQVRNQKASLGNNTSVEAEWRHRQREGEKAGDIES